jgi:oligoribonuclease
MKYVSIDIETTGLDENQNQIIEFGAIIEDSNDPKSYEDSKKFRRIVLARDGKYVFSSMAAKMNVGLIALIAKIESGVDPQFPTSDKNLTNAAIFSDDLIADFKTWLFVNGFTENGKGVLEVVAAGKNFASFDRKFIQSTPEYETYGIRFHHRSIDPSGYYIDWNNDTAPPSTEKCKERAGLTGEVKHEALADAWDVIQLLRKQYPHNSSAIIQP